MIGKTISHYKILEELGRGGMGVVYKARDTKLDRLVALKFLPSHLTKQETNLARFVQEAKAAAALNHPNVCTIHEIHDEGKNPFIVMEYVEGETLRSRISKSPLTRGDSGGCYPLSEVIDIAIHIAEALKDAHKKGIVHRDIKSENIMVTESGQVKVMDFGLAKLSDSVRLTKTGTTTGTAAYMSPEQARGEFLDSQTDIWSLGVVLYQLVTGQLPFTGEYEQAVIYSILNDDPKIPSDLHANLRQIIQKCLEKNPIKRYQKTEALIEDLKSIEVEKSIPRKQKKSSKKILFSVIPITITIITAVYIMVFLADKSKPSIAVLPFTDMSSEQNQEFFCDGMSEEIINALTHVENLRVIARTSAFAFKGKNEDVRSIGKKLGVEILLEGSVRKSGDRLRVTAQLIKASDGSQIWSNQWNRNLTDVFTIQDDISLAIVNQLKIKLFGKEEERIVRRLTDNLDAYHQYLRGRHILNRRKADDIYTAISYFEKALELDSLYVMGYVGLADAYALLPSYASTPAMASYSKSKEFVNRALKINDQVGEAYASLGWILILADWDWQRAEQAFQKGMALNPGYATLNHWQGYLYMILRDYEKALKKVNRALELDPLSPVINRVIGDVYYNASQYDKAVPALKKCLELEPCLPFAHLQLSGCYTMKLQYTEALEEINKEKACKGHNYTGADYAVGMIHARMGNMEEANQIRQQLESSGERSTGLASFYFLLGEKEKGYQVLEELVNDKNTWVIYINCLPDFEQIRHEPRFQALLKKIGFST